MSTKVRERNTKAAKLTSHQVEEIRRRYASGETQSSLCHVFDVGVAQIGKIVRNESWRSLPPAPASAQEIAASQSNLMMKLGIVPEGTTAPQITSETPIDEAAALSQQRFLAREKAYEENRGDGMSRLDMEIAKQAAKAPKTTETKADDKLTGFLGSKGDSK